MLEASGYSPWFERIHDEFPRSRPAVQSRKALRMLRYRQKLIKIRTMSKNNLQDLALQAGPAQGGTCLPPGQQQVTAPEMAPVMHWQREHWLQLMGPRNQLLLETIASWKARSKGCCITRLRMYPGIALLTSLCFCCTRYNRSVGFAIPANWRPKPASIRWTGPQRRAGAFC